MAGGAKLTFDEIVTMATAYVNRQACMDDTTCTPNFDIDEESMHMSIDKQDLIGLQNATEDGGEFEYVEGILGLESVNDELVQTFILVAFDENDKAMSLGEDANGNKYYGLERWRPRKKIVDAISPLTLNNATAVDTYLDALFT